MLNVLRSSKKVLVATLWSMRSRLPAAKLLWTLILAGLPFILCDAFTSVDAASTATNHSYDVNAGGHAHRAKNGKKWAADRPYSPGGWGYIGGTASTTSKSIANTPDVRVYQSDRNGNFSYKFDVPNGAYNITLRFAETYWEKAGQRKFDVFIEGWKALDRYDICAMAGCMKAVEQTFKNIQVRDSQLTIDFVSRRDNAMVSAISVTTSGSPAVPPPPGTPGPVVSPYGTPYPVSPVIASMSFDWSTHRRYAPGSDNWAITWADDGHQYAAYGDGGGFGGTNKDGRVSFGVARVEGAGNAYRGFNVFGGKDPENEATFGGKSYGIIAIDGVLYMWVSPGSLETGYKEARLYASDDYGASWIAADWAFTQSEGLIFPTFLQFGKDYQGARDGYVYVYANRLKSANKLTVQKPGEIMLLRVPKTNILERDSYEFFAGLDSRNNPLWVSTLAAGSPVFTDSRGVGWNTSASFNAGLGRYLLMTEHDASFQGNLGVFDAPEPWGPWTTVLYDSGFGAGEIETNTFFWNFSNKWLSGDGKDFTLIFTGVDSKRFLEHGHGKIPFCSGSLVRRGQARA